jgi:hypothetical protein
MYKASANPSMGSPSSSKKRIQITANFQSEAQEFYERALDDQGNIKKLAKNDQPTVTESKKVITTNPYEVECEGTNMNEKEGSGKKEVVNVGKPGYDISQL